MVGVSALVVLFLVLDLDRFFTLEFLKESQDDFQELYENNRLAVISIYVLIYFIVAGLSLPGAFVLTLVGGAIFGLVAGTIAVSIASTSGATLACLMSRYVLREWVQDKFGDKLKAINAGIEKEGGFYLFTLRLIPLFPFFVINLVMGLTRMPLRTFFWVSQLGMLPGTMVYVNAGKELGKIDSAAGILSPTLLISFAILGIFPLMAKKTMEFTKKKIISNTSGEIKDGEI